MGKLIPIPNGTRFGALEVQGLSSNKRHNRPAWKCLCDCGTVVEYTGDELRSGKRISCGCKCNQAVNLVNKKFNRLTVIERAENRYGTSGRSFVRWKCKCDCGNTIEVDSSSLTSGNTKSCGCLNTERIRKNIVDLTNQRFGRLVALRYEHMETNKGTRGYWVCQCDCGNSTNVASTHLISGNTKSCGCLNQDTARKKYQDLTGQQFGKLTALYYIPDYNNHKNSRWHCRCECGNEIDIITYSLTNPNGTRSCGCVNSKGEQKIAQLLRDNNIKFETQKTFDTCRFPDTNSLARFDFYIDNSYLIEYDGVQHFSDTKQTKWITAEAIKNTQKRDAYKNKWCQENNIPLIRIPYTQYANLSIEDLILKEEEKQ